MTAVPSRSTRRRFLQNLLLIAGAAGLAPPLLQACRRPTGPASGTARELVISSFPSISTPINRGSPAR